MNKYHAKNAGYPGEKKVNGGKAEQFLGKLQRRFENLKDAVKNRVDRILESGEPPRHRKAS